MSIKKGITLAKNSTPELAEKATKYYVNKGIMNLIKNLHQAKAQA